MNRPAFHDKLVAAVAASQSLLCVGLDPDPATFPAHFASGDPGRALLDWGRRILDQTAGLVCCYKPNIAFYEQFGAAGWEALRQTIAAVPSDIPVLLDAKRGDIGSTATAYARAAFDVLGADAVTLSPYLGRDSVAPFLAYAGKAAFVLCYTSNLSAAAIQEFGAGLWEPSLSLRDGSQRERLFEHVVQQAISWGEPEQIGLVVGATHPHALAHVRALLADRPCWILAPGIGAQGGDLSAALAAGLDANGSGLLVPVSRHVIYADDPRAAARKLRDAINAERAVASQRMIATTGPGSGRVPPVPPPSPVVDPLILALHDAGCVQFGEFTLASGVQSPVYLDLRRMASHPGLLRVAAAAYGDLLRPLSYDVLAAVPYAALTIGAAVALATDKPLIYPRKEVKAHGTGRAIEGQFLPGQRAVVIEDLVTSAGSVLTAIAALEAGGLAVSDVVVLIDRQQGGPESLAAAGYRLHAALTLSQVVGVLEAAGRIAPAQAAAVQAYLAL